MGKSDAYDIADLLIEKKVTHIYVYDTKHGIIAV